MNSSCEQGGDHEEEEEEEEETAIKKLQDGLMTVSLWSNGTPGMFVHSDIYCYTAQHANVLQHIPAIATNYPS